MTITELKTNVDAYRERLKMKAGRVCTTSDNGPVGMDLIDSIVAILETQQKQIDDLAKLVHTLS